MKSLGMMLSCKSKSMLPPVMSESKRNLMLTPLLQRFREIFGPILPIVVVDSVDEALQQIRPQTPLALYVFSQSDAFISKIRSKTQSGAFIVNDVMLHFNIGELPFGGVGESGTGSYHGKKSFDTFTHERSSMTTPFW